MSFDATDPFHVGVVVADLDAAMADLGAGLDLGWHSVQQRAMHVRYRGEVSRVELRFTYSLQGPSYVELLQGDAGSLWGPERAGLHHIGVWTDDFLADVAALEAAGFPVELTLASRSTEGPSAFTYHEALGVRIELVPVEMRPAFESWFAGGDFA